MDWLDRISIGAIAVLVAGTVLMVQADRDGQRTERPVLQRGELQEQAPADADFAAKLKVLLNLLEAGGLAEAEALAQDLIKRHPYQAVPHMLLGDVLMRMQDPVAAMHAYKRAIELDPDYLDKKTPQFQGKKMKIAVGEALAEIEDQLKQHPGDERLKAEKKTVYYLYRKIAGSCG
jgi:tetratricopeptide (TPR) repeat protein